MTKDDRARLAHPSHNVHGTPRRSGAQHVRARIFRPMAAVRIQLRYILGSEPRGHHERLQHWTQIPAEQAFERGNLQSRLRQSLGLRGQWWVCVRKWCFSIRPFHGKSTQRIEQTVRPHESRIPPASVHDGYKEWRHQLGDRLG